MLTHTGVPGIERAYDHHLWGGFLLCVVTWPLLTLPSDPYDAPPLSLTHIFACRWLRSFLLFALMCATTLIRNPTP
jgi:hypothetical protein